MWQISNITTLTSSWNLNWSLQVSLVWLYYYTPEEGMDFSEEYDLLDELGYANAKSLFEVGSNRFFSDMV